MEEYIEGCVRLMLKPDDNEMLYSFFIAPFIVPLYGALFVGLPLLLLVHWLIS